MAKNKRWYNKKYLWKKFRPNRKYKDRLFRFLFRDKKDLLQLYNAVNDSDYTNPNDLEIITLEDVIFMKMKNDLSFMIGNRLNLYEHQSTYSPNMPIRGLIYFSRQYEGIIAEEQRNVYGSKLIKLPTPEYVIFYNGMREQKDKTELYLSDSFETGRGTGCLECRAVMLNINRGHNKELMVKCRRVWEYAEFIAEVNDNLSKNMSLKRAIKNAMDNCIEKEILMDILVKNRAEVMHMLLTQYDEEKHMRDTYKEGYEEGEAAGYSKGKRVGEHSGYRKGEADGYKKGEHIGEQNGYNKLLDELIEKKLNSGKNVQKIAQELEMDVSIVEERIRSLNR